MASEFYPSSVPKEQLCNINNWFKALRTLLKYFIDLKIKTQWQTFSLQNSTKLLFAHPDILIRQAAYYVGQDVVYGVALQTKVNIRTQLLHLKFTTSIEIIELTFSKYLKKLNSFQDSTTPKVAHLFTQLVEELFGDRQDLFVLIDDARRQFADLTLHLDHVVQDQMCQHHDRGLTNVDRLISQPLYVMRDAIMVKRTKQKKVQFFTKEHRQ